ADEAEEAPLPPRDLEQRQRHRLRPDLLLAGHRRGAVETDDHRSPAVLVGAAEGVGEEAPLHQPAREVAAEQRVVPGCELGRQQALEVASQAHLEELLAGALEAPLADGEGLLAHAADQARELPELRVGGQAAPELDLASRRTPASRPEPGAPA